MSEESSHDAEAVGGPGPLVWLAAAAWSRVHLVAGTDRIVAPLESTTFNTARTDLWLPPVIVITLGFAWKVDLEAHDSP